MQIGTRRIPHARYLARAAKPMSRAARQRLRWMDHYRTQGRNAAFTCRYFGISRQTFYRWRRRYDPQELSSLEDRSHRPRRRRRPTWTAEQVQQVLRLRREYPSWGKDKLAVLLRREGCRIATSTVGRILTHLKARGQLVEPLRNGVKARRRPRPRPHAVRKPKDYAVLQPGDLVQVDTLEVRPLPGVVWKHFTARDLVSRWDVIGVYSRATATTATSFLTQLRERMPFPVRAIQVDGGSEFQAQFEQACERWGLSLFVLPPRSPKLNGHVERAQRTHTEEFYELIPDSFQLPALNRHLRAWERIYNTVRPHQTLGYRTPLEFLTQNQSLSKEPKCH